MAAEKTRLIISGRGAFLNLFEAKAFGEPEEGKKPEYSATFIFDPKYQETEEFKKLVGTVRGYIKKYWANGLPERFHNPIRKGDQQKNEDGTIRDGFAGNLFAKAKSYDKPGVVSQKKEPITDPSAIPSGYFIRATVLVKPFGHDAQSRKFSKGNAGIKLELCNVQLVAKGPRFDNKKSASEDFDEIDDGGSVSDVDDYDLTA